MFFGILAYLSKVNYISQKEHFGWFIYHLFNKKRTFFDGTVYYTDQKKLILLLFFINTWINSNPMLPINLSVVARILSRFYFYCSSLGSVLVILHLEPIDVNIIDRRWSWHPYKHWTIVSFLYFHVRTAEILITLEALKQNWVEIPVIVLECAPLLPFYLRYWNQARWVEIKNLCLALIIIFNKIYSFFFFFSA